MVYRPCPSKQDNKAHHATYSTVAVIPLACRYKVDRMYERPWLKCTIYTNAMNGCHKSLDGNKYTQVFATEQFFVATYPMESKSMSSQVLKEFISDFGVPDCITCDGASEQVRNEPSSWHKYESITSICPYLSLEGTISPR